MEQARRDIALRHVDDCEPCRTRLSELVRWLRSEPAAQTEDRADATSPAPGMAIGTTIDRYVILSTLGRGGMGVVYAAYDPALDRRIALKLIRPELLASARGAILRERLLREAQAMARLSHPNVAAIYDVGAMAEHVFIAMELLPGETLRTWLVRSPRTLRDVIALFVAAGQGLAAAHAMGIVHRDFKPENVLCSHDGRVAVTDFGLAHLMTPGASGEPTAGDGLQPPPSHEPLTRASTVLGTPAYMAPEMRAHSIADARSDQYAFAVSLYEAIYGHRPTDVVIDPPQPRTRTGRPVPAPLRAVLRTALAEDPDARFPDMDALIRAIETSLRSRRRLVVALAAIGVGAVSLSLNITGALHGQPSPLDACLAGRAAAGQVWNGGAADAVSRGFLGTGVPFAADAAASTRRRLDAFVAAWSETYTDVCDASWRRGEQSTALLDARLSCLRRSKDSAAGLVALLTGADRTTVTKADELVTALVTTDCRAAELDPQRAQLALPAVLRVEAAERALDGVSRQATLGRFPDARRAIEPLWTEAHALGFEPLMARVLLERGWLEDVLGDYAAAEATLTEATWHAAAGGVADVELMAICRLASVVGYRFSRFDDAARILPRATALLARLGNQPDPERRSREDQDEGRARAALELFVIQTQGKLATRQGQYDLALAAFERGITVAQHVNGHDSANTAKMVNSAGNSLEKLGRYPEARQRYEEALAIQRRALGDAHPDLADTHENLAVLATIEKHFEQARDELATARTLLTPILGADHVKIADLLEETALSYQEQDRDRDAIPYHEQALAIAERQLGADSAIVARYLSNYALIMKHLSRFDRAQQMLERVLAVETRTLGAEHPDRAITLLSLGQVQQARGNLKAALVYVRQARDILTRRLGADHPDTRAASETEAEIVAASRPAR